MKEFDVKQVIKYDKDKTKNKRGDYGKSSDKSPRFEELDYLRYNLNNRRDKIILIGVGFAGLRIEEFVQNRLAWMYWEILENGEKKMRVLRIRIPEQDKEIVNPNSKLPWSPKTKQSIRSTYILDETLAETFMNFYQEHPKGISELFKTKKTESVCRNISSYIIAVQWLEILREYHRKKLLEKYKGVEIAQSQIEEELDKIRSRKYPKSRLSAHAFRSAYENLLFYRYKISLDISSSILGHTPKIAEAHYIAKTEKNIELKLGSQLMK